MSLLLSGYLNLDLVVQQNLDEIFGAFPPHTQVDPLLAVRQSTRTPSLFHKIVYLFLSASIEISNRDPSKSTSHPCDRGKSSGVIIRRATSLCAELGT